jgi:phage/plasmid-associated DNA primase
MLFIENFVSNWLRNNPSQRSYDDIGNYPDKSKCPINHFNSWKAFAMDTVSSYKTMPDELAIIRNHIKILCDNDEQVATYFEAWIAQMIQFPAIKSVCPVLISKEGAGKGSLMRLFERMLGDSKVFETATPSRDIWGDFNGRMASTFLVNLNELSKKETVESEGRIKALITDPKLTINNKGVNQYDINSHHRFIITTNKEEPINTAKDDRRKFIIRSSDELIGNELYFTKLHEMLNDLNVIKTCYEYFKTIPDMNEFGKLKLPSTEYQEELKEMSVSPLENWLKDLTLEHYYDKENVEILDKKQYDLFKCWCKKCGIEYNLSSIQFGVRMKRLAMNGMEFGKHTKNGNTRIFNFTLLKEHFKLNNIEVDTTEDDDDDDEGR